MLFLMKQYFAETLQVDVHRRRKGTLISKSHIFYDLNHNTEPLSINVFVCVKMLLAKVIKKNKPQKICFHRTRRFATQQHKTNTFSRLIIETSP